MTLIYAKTRSNTYMLNTFSSVLMMSIWTNNSLEIKCTVIDSGTDSNGPSQGSDFSFIEIR